MWKAVVCVKSIEEGFIHQTVGTKETEEELDLDYCIGGPTRQEVNYAMSNSLGFGGHNAVLLMEKNTGESEYYQFAKPVPVKVLKSYI